MNETELERMVVRLMGDGRDYQRMLSQAQRATAETVAEMGRMLTAAGVMFTAAVTTPIIALGTGIFQAAATLDGLTRGLTSVTGSAEETERQLVRLREAAKQPGVGFKEAIQGATQLQATGRISAEMAERAMLGFGNALATVGKGKYELGLVLAQLTQVASTEFIQGDEIRILAEHVPQLRKILLDAFGTARGEDLKKLGVTSEQAIEAMVAGFERLNVTSGGVQNSMSNLSDVIFITMAKLGTVVLEIVGPAFDKLSVIVERTGIWFEELDKDLQRTIFWVAAAVAALGPLMIVGGSAMMFFSAFASTVIAVGAVFIGFLPEIAAVAVGIVALGLAVTQFVGMDTLRGWWEDGIEAGRTFLTMARGFLANFGENVGIIAKYVVENWRAALTDVSNFSRLVWQSIPVNAGVAAETLMRLFMAFGGWFTATVPRYFYETFVVKAPGAMLDGFRIGLQYAGAFFSTLGDLVHQAGVVLYESFKSILSGEIPAVISNAAFEVNKSLSTLEAKVKPFMDRLQVEFNRGALDKNLFRTFDTIFREQLNKLQDPVAAFKSTMAEFPELNLNLDIPEEELKQLAGEAQKAAMQVKQLKAEFHDNTAIIGGTKEMRELLGSFAAELENRKASLAKVQAPEVVDENVLAARARIDKAVAGMQAINDAKPEWRGVLPKELEGDTRKARNARLNANLEGAGESVLAIMERIAVAVEGQAAKPAVELMPLGLEGG